MVASTNEHSRAAHYGAAIGLAATALLLNAILSYMFETGYFLRSIAVLLSALYGGFGPGLLTTALCGLGSSYFFMIPVGSLQIASPENVGRLTLFLADGASLSAVGAILRMAPRKQLEPVWARYGMAILLVILAIALKMAILPNIERQMPFTFFYTAVAASAWAGGTGPGLLAVCASAVSAAFFFLSPRRSMEIADIHEAQRLALFCVESLALCFLCASHYSARQIARLCVGRVKEAEGQLQSIFKASPAGIVLASSDLKIVRANPAFCEMLGYEDMPLDHPDLRDILHQDSRERVVQFLQSVIRGERPSWESEERCLYRGGGGQVVWVNMHASLLEQGRQDPGSCLIIAEDITARKRDEENLREQEWKLRQAQKMEAIGLLAGGIAHDFNNLLTIILGYTQQILASAGKRSRLKEDAEEVRKAASHAAELVAQLLTFARKHPGSVEQLNLNDIVTDTVRLLRRLIGSNIKLETILADGAGLINADRRNIEQILMNLVTNARDAMPQGGKITIETVNVDISQNGAVPIGDASPGRYVGLYVRDTGQGMDEETAARIFEPFFTTKEGGKGTGLGLSTVYGVVKQSGGHIQVASKPGQGTSFKILFPRFQAEIAAADAIGSKIIEGLGGVETVLVAEDDDSVRGLVVQVLRREGYRVLHARDGFKAMELAGPEGGKVDLLLTDVMMPGMRGPELARILLGRNPRIKVLFMSGYEQGAEDRPVGGELGFLAKPFSPEELAQKVRDLLDRPPAPTGTP